MSRRHHTQFSLFAFQDIITGLCGIVILFVLIMLVDVVVKRDRGTKPERVELDVLTKTEDLKSEIVALKDQLEDLRKKTRQCVVVAGEVAAPEMAHTLKAERGALEKEVAALISQVSDLRTRVAKAVDADAENRRKVKEMEETRRLLENKLASLKERKGVTLIQERGEFKAPIYLVLDHDKIEVVRPLKKNVYRKSFSFWELKLGVQDVMLQLDHTTHTVILLVRPSGVARMDEVFKFVTGLGFSCGRDPLEEDVAVYFGEENAE